MPLCVCKLTWNKAKNKKGEKKLGYNSDIRKITQNLN